MIAPPMMRVVRSSGTLMIVASAAGFGAMAVFGKLAYDEGVTVGTLLSARFVIAAALFWLIVVASGTAARDLRALTPRVLGVALALGAAGYAIQAGAYFAALERIDASLLTLVLYTFPAMVAIAAFALGRERLDGRRVAALALAAGGLALVVATAGTGALEPLGVGLALAAAVTYSTYILVSDAIVGELPPALLSALVATGAALTVVPATALLGDLHPGAVTAVGWGWLACLALISTVAAVMLFFCGLRRVGPTTASIVSTVEPVITVALAVVIFGEALGPWQALGGALVLSAVFVLHLPERALASLRARRPAEARA